MQIRKILMVDDDAYIRRIGEISLKKVGGWEVAQAASGAEALEMIVTESPDVVLLDVMMPGMDGPAVLQKILSCRSTAHIPVIFMTAKIQSHELERYLNLDAAGVISKPFDPISLPQEIKAIVASFEQHAKIPA